MLYLGNSRKHRRGNDSGKKSHTYYRTFDLRLNENELQVIQMLCALVNVPKGYQLHCGEIDFTNSVKGIRRGVRQALQSLEKDCPLTNK